MSEWSESGSRTAGDWSWKRYRPGDELQVVRSGLGLFLMQAGVALGLDEGQEGSGAGLGTGWRTE